MASTGDTWRLGRRPALDGLRGVAVVLVLLAHGHVPGFEAAGLVGVTVFFTLSGFLITRLLLEDHADHGTIRLGRFYTRRALRLAPALAACIAVAAALGAMSRGLAPGAGIAGAALYVSNWVLVLDPGHYIGVLSHTWSLAIEEQFYLVWPAVIIATRARPRLLLGIAGAGIIGSAAARLLLWDGGAGAGHIDYGFDTHADALLVGCALAVIVGRRGTPAGWSPAVGAGIATLLLLSLTGDWFAVVVMPLMAALVAAGVIAWSLANGRGLLMTRWLTLIGKRSYGLYLWHYPASVLVTMCFGASWLPQLLIMVPVSALLTALSWRYIETPFLRMKDRQALSSTSRQLAADRPAVTVPAGKSAALTR